MAIDTQSRRDYGDGYGLILRRKSDSPAYLSSAEDVNDPLASPLAAGDFSHLPPALMITAEFDPLRDEGELYATALRDDGVPVDLVRQEGMIHGFWAYGRVIREASQSIAYAGKSLRAALANPAQSGVVAI
ncbi:hypothetical protein FDG2_0389 [Candidatus Protofrankia californiensis]|uniref:Alpha/beta hydrolase fold-3 domain-containing protein n=1 Tax=Candidatus Protofrankia californiensis TaxID=1839754 RepID=A0A1C3NTL1_9ACTN|nr:hypothetical protein FDG2_0389 [Candidatus Protofrankia californiensis]